MSLTICKKAISLFFLWSDYHAPARRVRQGFAMTVNEKLLDMLACPACEDRPKVVIKGDGIHCPKCGRIYPVADGIPIMLIDKAEPPGNVGSEG